MSSFLLSRKTVLAIFSAGVMFAAPGNTDVPLDYKGHPYGGTPWPVPGRLDFENYDLGGLNIAWKSDDKAGDAVAPGSTAANRANDGETQHPAFWITNSNVGEVDKLPDGSLYPSADSPKSIYIGAAHATDYTTTTINVAKAGTYWFSAHFASQPNEMKFHISINKVNKMGIITLPGTNSYHAWRFYKNFAHVDLEAGVQALQFMLDSYHVNMDYISLSSDSSITVGVNPAGLRAARNPAFNAVIVPMGKDDAARLGFLYSVPGSNRFGIFDGIGRRTQGKSIPLATK